MPVHEHKLCPRCGNMFECNSGTVTQCQCRGVVVTPVQRDYIAARYDGCLCRVCLAALGAECDA